MAFAAVCEISDSLRQKICRYMTIIYERESMAHSLVGSSIRPASREVKVLPSVR